MAKYGVPKLKRSTNRAGTKRRRKGTKKRQAVSKTEVLSAVRSQLETHMSHQEIDELEVVIGQDVGVGFLNALNRGDLSYQFNGKQVSPVSFTWKGHIRPKHCYIRGKNSILTTESTQTEYPSLGRPQDISDIYEQQYYVRVVFALQQSNVKMTSTGNPASQPVASNDNALLLGNGDLPVGVQADHKDLYRKFNWAKVKPFYDKTFFMNGDPLGEGTRRIECHHKFRPTDVINYTNATIATSHEPTGTSPPVCHPDNLGVVMFVFTRYANDDYPTFLDGLAAAAGVSSIVGGTNGAAPNLEIMGESEFRFKDA